MLWERDRVSLGPMGTETLGSPAGKDTIRRKEAETSTIWGSASSEKCERAGMHRRAATSRVPRPLN